MGKDVLVLLTAAVLLDGVASRGAAAEEEVRFGRFGAIHLYSPARPPSRVALFVSGDGGWNQGVVDMARELATLDALVVGVDIRTYLRSLAASSETCSYPAADFEALSKFVQHRQSLPSYRTPILVGYSSGATLVYATLVQAPSTTFAGAISMGFCPDLPLTKPMCRGSGLTWTTGPKGRGYSFLPSATLEPPWVALQGTIDQVCDPMATEAFTQKVKGARLVLLPKVGHGFSVPRNWLAQFKTAFEQIAEAGTRASDPPRPQDLGDLPLVEVPSPPDRGRTMAVILTGDGGFGVTDRGIAESLAKNGTPAVALNSLHYFWSPKSPEQAAKDLGRIMLHYLAEWRKEDVILIGYSFGADALPFLITRLPSELRNRIQKAAFVGLGKEADFEFHLSDWLVSKPRSTSRPVLPELEKLKGLELYCFYGVADAGELCKEVSPSLATSIALEGGHRVGANFQGIVRTILQQTR